jgi:hypothetical protein
MEDLEKKDRLVDRLVKENRIEAAVKLLFELTVAAAAEKNFSRAESLRNRLLEVDPLALTEITRSADIIEAEKSKLLDQNHLRVWKKLYDTLTTEETHALFFAMKHAEYSPGTTVYEQGAKNANLYFVDQGRLKMVCRTQDKNQEILIKTLGPGEFSGDDVFFSTTAFNSVSLIAESPAKLKILNNSVLKDWSTGFPGLNPKLTDHCLRAGLIHDLIRDMNINRRKQKRIEIPGIGVFQFQKSTGEVLGNPFKGTLSDISPGGLSFYMRVSKKETVRLLLGRKLSMKFKLPTKAGDVHVERTGDIIGLREDDFQDYSIHTRFDKELEPGLIESIPTVEKEK